MSKAVHLFFRAKHSRSGGFGGQARLGLRCCSDVVLLCFTTTKNVYFAKTRPVATFATTFATTFAAFAAPVPYAPAGRCRLRTKMGSRQQRRDSPAGGEGPQTGMSLPSALQNSELEGKGGIMRLHQD